MKGPASWFLPSANGFGFIVLAAAIWGALPAAAHAAWGVPYLAPPRPAQPPDQSWLQDPPERSSGRSRGTIAVVAFRGDDVYEPVRAAVVQTLRRRGFNVTARLRPVDSARELREMSYEMHLTAYVEGEVKGEGPKQTARIRLRSGVTGQPISSATFSGPTKKIAGEVDRTFWTRVGPAMTRACTHATRPRQREREPMRIDASLSPDS